MSQLLDLCITLTSSPDGSPPDVIASIAIRCDALGLNHMGNLLRDPLTQQERVDLRWYLEEYWKWPYLEFAERGKQVEVFLPRLGKRLYEAVFRHTEANQIVRAWQHYPAVQHQISIISDLPRVLGLPWELLHDGAGFLAVRASAPIALVRRLHMHERAAESKAFEPPLRILFVIARPRGAGFVDPRRLARELLYEVQEYIDTGIIELEFLHPPTLSALRARLQETERPIQVLHFDGHGVFNAQDKQSILAFEDDRGDLHLVNAAELATILRNSGMQLVVLTACHSAHSATDDILSSVAAQLLLGGIDAVVAMSATILTTSAASYATAFYHALASGTPLPLAQEQARLRLFADPHRHLLHRRSDEEGTAVELQDWWVPHSYQQCPLLLQSTQVKRTNELSLHTFHGHTLNKDMPARSIYGFIGRARELLRMERLLLRKKLIVISGFGGIGKTALACEAAEWFTRTGIYTKACFISFEHGGDATWLLSTLGHFLGVYDGFYRPDDTQKALTRLRPILSQQRTLVIADNLESNLLRGEAPVDIATRTHLWDVLLELANLGAGVLLTSSDTAFEDKRLARGRKVAYLALKGLHPEDAYALASRLLDTLGIDRARAPYAEVRDLLARLDHHPLAIQLVFPALCDHTIAETTSDFVKLLPAFVDDHETGRNRSLLASLEYSLQRLSDEQPIFLSRLAAFEGGASEDDLLAVTEIPAEVWATLRPALEQAALITAEQVHEDVRIPFLHFHPILAPYLRSQQGSGEVILLQRYAQRYHTLADLLSRQDAQHPEAVRALARRELPNLRHALELLLQNGEVEAASDMAESVAKFLTNFGLMRERDRIRQLVADAMHASGSDRHGPTYAEYLHESGLAEDEWSKGKLQAAAARLTKLLARIEVQPEGKRAGRGSYSHCVTLHALARCLEDDQRFVEAEHQYRAALSIVDELLKQNPEEQDYLAQRALLLCDIGDVLSQQGHYSQAKENYEAALKTYTAINHLRGQSVVLTQMGYLAFLQQNYSEARLYYHEALEHFSTLGEPTNEAIGWYQLGMIAREQEDWTEAEHCYRESLAREERLGNLAGVAVTCNQLAVIAESAGRSAEAEGWYRRALELYRQVEPESIAQARVLNNLADLLVNEARAGRAPETRLAEARDYAERSLRIKERPGISAEVWKTFETLARIAELEGQPEMAQAYRRRDRESFAAFAGNRYQIDQQFALLIAVIVSATRGNDEARVELEAIWPELEQQGWRITDAVQRIWAGEWDWHALVVNLDRGSALVVLRVLETLAQQPEIGPSAEKGGIEGATDDKAVGVDGSENVGM